MDWERELEESYHQEDWERAIYMLDKQLKEFPDDIKARNFYIFLCIELLLEFNISKKLELYLYERLPILIDEAYTIFGVVLSSIKGSLIRDIAFLHMLIWVILCYTARGLINLEDTSLLNIISNIDKDTQSRFQILTNWAKIIFPDQSKITFEKINASKSLLDDKFSKVFLKDQGRIGQYLLGIAESISEQNAFETN